MSTGCAFSVCFHCEEAADFKRVPKSTMEMLTLSFDKLPRIQSPLRYCLFPNLVRARTIETFRIMLVEMVSRQTTSLNMVHVSQSACHEPWTLLEKAVDIQDWAAVQELIRMGADVNQTVSLLEAATPRLLLRAVRAAATSKNDDIGRSLMQAGARLPSDLREQDEDREQLKHVLLNGTFPNWDMFLSNQSLMMTGYGTSTHVFYGELMLSVASSVQCELALASAFSLPADLTLVIVNYYCDIEGFVRFLMSSLVHEFWTTERWNIPRMQDLDARIAKLKADIHVLEGERSKLMEKSQSIHQMVAALAAVPYHARGELAAQADESARKLYENEEGMRTKFDQSSSLRQCPHVLQRKRGR